LKTGHYVARRSGCYARVGLSHKVNVGAIMRGDWGAQKRFHAMSDEKRERELGMDCPISRRDFLNGIAVGAGSVLVGEPLLAAMDGEENAPERAAGYYPPALTGLRGNHDGTFK